ncbi:MAG: hypothetical protein ACM3VZ_09490 [Acidobacteriota bacterium]
MQLIEFLERLGNRAARFMWGTAIVGAMATAAVAYLWWRIGHETVAMGMVVWGVASVLPCTMLAEALSDLASVRRTVGQGYQRITQPGSTARQRTAHGVISAVSISWLIGSAAMLSNPFWWLVFLIGLMGCATLTVWASLWTVTLLFS